MSRNQHTSVFPERHVYHPVFQGALSDAHSSSKRSLSRSVSIGCQNPVCLNADNCPVRASVSSGPCSQTVESPSIRSRTEGSRQKKPPLIQPDSPGGFSWNPQILYSSRSITPKRPGG